MSNREVKLEVEDPAPVEEHIRNHVKVGAVASGRKYVRFALTSKHAGAFDLQSYVEELTQTLGQEVEVLSDEMV